MHIGCEKVKVDVRFELDNSAKDLRWLDNVKSAETLLQQHMAVGAS